MKPGAVPEDEAATHVNILPASRLSNACIELDWALETILNAPSLKLPGYTVTC